MAAPTVPAPRSAYVTLDAFYEMYELPKLTELCDGEIVTQPFPSADHGFLVRAIYDAIRDYTRSFDLGDCFFDGFGYELPIAGRPDTYRIPDVSFVRAGRIPRPRRRGRALAIAPDLAVEVRSPSDTPGVLRRKLVDYQDAGTPLVWVIDGDTRSTEVYAAGVPVHVLREADALDGGAVLPGFTLPLAQLFAELDD